MRIVLNGKPCTVTANQLDQILFEQGYRSETIATALNGVFVHKQNRSETLLKQDDRLEVVAPIQGG
jgi:sulfur carrier protein